jgi:hypothetical protein
MVDLFGGVMRLVGRLGLVKRLAEDGERKESKNFLGTSREEERILLK